MKQLNDYQCSSCNSTIEYLANPQDTIHCDCGCEAKMTKVISGGFFYLDGACGDFPTAADKWTKRRDKQIAHEQRHQS
jgi:hypothetical protein